MSDSSTSSRRTPEGAEGAEGADWSDAEPGAYRRLIPGRTAKIS
ncbi:hypothetical protein [Streptomyces sp. MA5143a]|nr:hypothetical protein [Streptomyces sp. MA5143a]